MDKSGSITLKVVGAELTDKIDAYVKITAGEQTFKSAVIDSGTTSSDETFTINVRQDDSYNMLFEVFNSANDEKIGEVADGK